MWDFDGFHASLGGGIWPSFVEEGIPRSLLDQRNDAFFLRQEAAPAMAAMEAMPRPL